MSAPTAKLPDVTEARPRLVSSQWSSLGQFCRYCHAGPFKRARSRRKHEVVLHERKIAHEVDLNAALLPTDPEREPGESDSAFRQRVRAQLRRIAWGAESP